MNKNTKILISVVALLSILLVGKEVINSSDSEKEKIEYLETKIESLENELQSQNKNIDEEECEELIETTNISPKELEENDNENFYDTNTLRIIEKTYKDGTTRKSLVIASASYSESSKEFEDIKELTENKYTKVRIEFYSLLKGEWLGYQETIGIENEELSGTYSKIQFDGYTIIKRNINNPNFSKYNYEEYSDNVEIKVFSLEKILAPSLVKAKYTLSDLLEIIIELDGKVEDKIEDIIVNKLIR